MKVSYLRHKLNNVLESLRVRLSQWLEINLSSVSPNWLEENVRPHLYGPGQFADGLEYVDFDGLIRVAGKNVQALSECTDIPREKLAGCVIMLRRVSRCEGFMTACDFDELDSVFDCLEVIREFYAMIDNLDATSEINSFIDEICHSEIEVEDTGEFSEAYNYTDVITLPDIDETDDDIFEDEIFDDDIESLLDDFLSDCEDDIESDDLCFDEDESDVDFDENTDDNSEEIDDCIFYGNMFEAYKYSWNLDYVPFGNGYAVSGIGRCKDTCLVVRKQYFFGYVNGVADAAFMDCKEMLAVELPDTVTFIGNNAFDGCSKLCSIIMLEGINSIGSRAFCGCTSLGSIKIPDGVTEAGKAVFRDCESLIYAEIGKGLTAIPDMMFSGCRSLESILFGNNIKQVGEKAFFRCGSLRSVYFYGSTEEWTSTDIESFNDEIVEATIFFYSESEPLSKGSFWHYDKDCKPVIW